MNNRVHIRILAIGLCLLLTGSGVRADSDDTALRLRAAFVLNFLKFAEWPVQTQDGADALLIFAIVGSNGMTSVLRETLEGRTLDGRAIEVRTFSNPSRLTAGSIHCHALYVEVSAHTNWRAVRIALEGRPVLTIAEMPGFCLEGGMLNLVQKEDRMRFEANPYAAGEAGVTLRAELLNLATIVETTKEAR